MEKKIQHLKLRKLSLSDYDQFKKLFFICFKKKISFQFFKWRYFSDKFSFCYGVFDSQKLIANVGMLSISLSNKKKDRIFSRHSSMVDPNYRGKGIFSKLLIKVKKIIKKKVFAIVMWPNKNNHSNFGFKNKNLIKKKLYIYETKPIKISSSKVKNIPISKINKFKDYVFEGNSFFLKNMTYFNKRYLLYKKKEYILNKFNYKGFNSFFVLKYLKHNKENKYILLDHFGSNKVKEKHLSCLIKEKKKFIFLSKKKINYSNFKIINSLNFKFATNNKINLKKIKNFLEKKDIFLGDTDNFINLN
jgi:GNAT superfamily N-acetyltransferase